MPVTGPTWSSFTRAPWPRDTLPVRYDLIRRAVERLDCPVLANGHIYEARQALRVLRETGARGWMIGRAAIRNPWIFRQIRQALAGEPIVKPTGRDLLRYIEQLWETYATPGYPERLQTQRLKLFTNFIGEGLGPDSDAFLFEIRRTQTRAGSSRSAGATWITTAPWASCRSKCPEPRRESRQGVKHPGCPEWPTGQSVGPARGLCP